MNANTQSHTCDPNRLESFLSGALSDIEERDLTAHLSTCEICRRALEEQAATPQFWSEAQELLKPSAFDPEETRPSLRQPLEIQHVLGALKPTDDPDMLGRMGGYEVSGVVGSGGMGVVLKAVDKSLDRTVAIKVLSPHLASSGAARKRFSREAKAAAAVLHPNVIAIHSVSNDEDLPYLIMPYVRGASLQKRIDREGPLSLQEILRIGSQIAAGLAAAHAQGLVHRDIKPANILLEDGVERVTITDFGLARAVDDATITHSGVIAGTPQYMSPEQARGESVGQQSDLFSLGSVLYATCTGRPPFRAETSYGIMRRITDDEPTPIREINPDVPEWLCTIVSRLMSKRAVDRFATADEVRELLETCLAHVQQPSAVPLPKSLTPRSSSGRGLFGSRKRFIAFCGAIGALVLGVIFWQATTPPDISGHWTGAEWGDVALQQTEPGKYTGMYNDTFGKTNGTIQIKWSRIERRFNGTWSEGKDRFGKISVRLVDDEIRGAWTTSKESEIQSGIPRLADLAWTRIDAKSAKGRGTLPVDFQPFDCVLVDKKTKEPVPGSEFSIGFVFEIPKTNSRPWQLVDEVFIGPDHSGEFQFTIPEKVLKHPERDLIQVRWGVVHPTLDIADGYDPPRVNEILFDDPRTARESLRTIPLHPANIRKGDRLERYNEFTARVFLLQRLGVQHVGRDQLVALYEDLLKRFPNHPDRAEAMYDIAGLWQNGTPGTDEAPDYLKESIWLRDACAAARKGTRIWFESRFRLQGSLHHASPEESLQILDEIQANNPSAVNDVRAWNERVTIALSDGDEELAEKICRQLHDRMSQQEGQPEDKRELGDYFSYIQSSASSLLSYWFEQHCLRGMNRKVKIETLVSDYPLQHMQRYYDELSTMYGVPRQLSANPNSEKAAPILTAKQAVERGQELYHSRKTVSVRFKVAGVVTVKVTDEKGDTSEWWKLMAEGTEDFSAMMSPEVQEYYRKHGIDDLNQAFMGKEIEVQGEVRAVGLDLIGRPDTVWTYHVDVESIDQLRLVNSTDDAIHTETRLELLSAKQVVDRGQELYLSREKITVRFKVAEVTLSSDTDDMGNRRDWLLFTADGTSNFFVRLAPETLGVNRLIDNSQIGALSKHLRGEEFQVAGVIRALVFESKDNVDPRWKYYIDITSPEQVGEPREETEASIRYRGRCLQNEDGKPIAGAVVQFWAYRHSLKGLKLWKTTRTDSRGNFEIAGEFEDADDFDQQRSQITISAQGRASEIFPYQIIGEPSLFRMEPASSISGVVTYQGQPVEGATVQFGARQLPGVNDAMTNADGTFDIDDMRASRDLGFVVASHPEFESVSLTFLRIPAKVELEFWNKVATESERPKVHKFEATGDVHAIAVTPDGERLAIFNVGDPNAPPGMSKPTVDLVAAKTGTAIRRLELQTNVEDEILVSSDWLPETTYWPMEISPDAKLLAVTAGFGRVKIFNLETGEMIRSLDDEPGKLADKTTPESLKTLKRAMGSVHHLAFSPDGNLLVTSGESFEDVARNWGGIDRLGRLTTSPGRLKVWDVNTGALKYDLVGHSHAGDIAFSSDAVLLASSGRWESGNDHGIGVQIWNVATGEKVRTIEIPSNGFILDVEFAPNRNLLLISSVEFDKENDTRSQSISVVHAMSGVVEWKRTIDGIPQEVAFSGDGSNVLRFLPNVEIEVYGRDGGNLIQTIDLPKFEDTKVSRWGAFDFSARANRLFSVGVRSGVPPVVAVWDLTEPLSATNPSNSSYKDLKAAIDKKLLADAETDPEKRKQLLRIAAEAYEDVYRKYRSQMTGLDARISQAKCLEMLGETEQAKAIFSELLELPGTDERTETLKASIRDYLTKPRPEE